MDSAKYSAHQLLLLTFTAPRRLKPIPSLPEGFDKPNWTSALNESPGKATAKFIDDGLIVKADIAAHLDYYYDEAQIQDVLGKNRLPTAGDKSELIERLIKSGGTALPVFEEDQALYVISAKGKKSSREFASSGEPDYMFKRTAAYIISAVIGGIIGNRADQIFVDSLRGAWAGLKEIAADKTVTAKDRTDRTEPPQSGVIRLKTFEFETVRLNDRGSVIERRKGTARYFAEDLGLGISLEMVEIPGGKFLMGSPEKEAGRYVSEGPQHEVRVSPFFIGKFAITQEQWRTVAGWPKVKRDLKPEPSDFKDRKGSDKRPVESISWEEAQEFCARLSAKTGKAYRLPSEAEWEYACRAGTRTPFAFGETITPEIVNYDGNYPYSKAKKGKYRQETVPVGSLGVANAFGLFDMHGNVWEWCRDWYGNYPSSPQTDPTGPNGGTRCVLRGGMWGNYARFSRSAARDHHAPGFRFNAMGFRVVCGARIP